MAGKIAQQVKKGKGKFQKYSANRMRERNKARRIIRHMKKYPNDVNAAATLVELRKKEPLALADVKHQVAQAQMYLDYIHTVEEYNNAKAELNKLRNNKNPNVNMIEKHENEINRLMRTAKGFIISINENYDQHVIRKMKAVREMKKIM